jgi:hypothetical protein
MSGFECRILPKVCLGATLFLIFVSVRVTFALDHESAVYFNV